MSITREQAKAMRRLSPTNWTRQQCLEMGRIGGRNNTHSAKLANLRLGPVAAVAARAEYRRLIEQRTK